ncbi:unnamed protein product [Mytilus edulis]|uniref:Uncharacterized protein n=1 Tax=Mytilus edulis TaxID=6550 RepID=A0A8S3SN31_MYTED|nr:unnamed protein product [Mytilus edulis]
MAVFVTKLKVDPNYAFAVVALDEINIAVTSPKINDLCIMFIDLYSKEVTKIKTKYECRAITVRDGKLLSISPKLGILSIDANNGNVLSTIEKRLPNYTLLTSFKSKLYIGDPDINTISCCEMDGTTIWSFKDDTVITNPRGIAVDGMGNVYITNGDQNNVTVISSDGNQSKQLLSKVDGLKIPTAIQYDRKTKSSVSGKLC